MIHLKHGYQLVALSPIVNENVSQPLDNLSSDMEFLAMTFIIVRVMLEPSAPSAKMYRACFLSMPHISKTVDSKTPVNSAQLNIPWVYCTDGRATLPHSGPVLAPHSMK